MNITDPASPAHARAYVPEPRVVAVVLNWCDEPLTRACLDSLGQSTYPALRVLLVDNGSEDGSGDRLHRAFPDIDYLQTGRNLGYAGGNNRGIEWALERGADYVLVLNNDTVVDPACVGRLVRTAQDGAGWVGGVAPKILYYDRPGVVWYGGGSFSAARGLGVHRGEDQPDDPAEPAIAQDVTFMTGCCCLLSAQALRDVGAFEESLFAYVEDAELCVRLARSGWAMRYQPAARVLHHMPRSGELPSPFQIRQRDRNRRWLMRRHFPLWRRIPFLARFYVTRAFLAARYLARGDLARIRAVVAGAFGTVKPPLSAG